MTYQLFNFVYQIFRHITWDIYIRHQYHLGSAFAFALILPLPYGSICSNLPAEILSSLGMEHGLFACRQFSFKAIMKNTEPTPIHESAPVVEDRVNLKWRAVAEKN